MESVTKSSDIYEIVHYHTELPFRIRTIYQHFIYRNSEVLQVLDHWHKEMEIIYCKSAHGIYSIDGVSHPSAAGTLMVVNSGSIHRNSFFAADRMDGKPDMISTVLNISDTYLRKIIPNFDSLYFKPVYRPEDPRVIEIMETFTQFREGIPLKKYENLRLMGLLDELLYYLCRDDLTLKELEVPEKSQKNFDILRNIISFTNIHFREDINELSVSQAFNYSASYFSRFFKANMGIAYSEFLARTRIHAAEDDLVKTDKPVMRIALDSGFSDARSLINTFRRYEGVTPLKYRKKARQWELGDQTAGLETFSGRSGDNETGKWTKTQGQSLRLNDNSNEYADNDLSPAKTQN